MALIREDFTRQPIERITITGTAAKMDEAVAEMSERLYNEGWEYVNVSPSIPVVISFDLKYTVTLTAGKFT